MFYQCSQPCNRSPPTHTSAGDSWTLTGRERKPNFRLVPASQRSYPSPKVSGDDRGELPAATAQERQRGATPRRRLGAAAERSSPMSKERRLRRRRRAKRSYSTFKVRSSCEEIPHGQGKRNPSKTVGITRGHQRAETLKP